MLCCFNPSMTLTCLKNRHFSPAWPMRSLWPQPPFLDFSVTSLGHTTLDYLFFWKCMMHSLLLDFLIFVHLCCQSLNSFHLSSLSNEISGILALCPEMSHLCATFPALPAGTSDTLSITPQHFPYLAPFTLLLLCTHASDPTPHCIIKTWRAGWSCFKVVDLRPVSLPSGYSNFFPTIVRAQNTTVGKKIKLKIPSSSNIQHCHILMNLCYIWMHLTFYLHFW